MWSGGWKNGEWKCPQCETIIGKNLLGESPYSLVHEHRCILCSWCDDQADGKPVKYAGESFPACKKHSAEYNTPISYANEDFDRINSSIR